MNGTQPPRRPGWVKALGVAALILVVVLVVIALTTSGHGPGRHM